MKNKKNSKSITSIFKPGILFLLLISGIAAVSLAGGWKSKPEVMLYILIFGILAAASANILNNYVDRDIDKLMVRTRMRPLPAGKIKPESALLTGLILGCLSVILFWFLLNPLSSVLALGGIVFYVVVYSMYLKQRTSQNIVLGGFAAMFPPAVGWAAVTETISATPILIGLLVVLWTPPHFWALAIVYKADYIKAKIPMLPVVAGERDTREQMVIYSAAMVVISIFIYFYSSVGLLYLSFASIMGILFLYLTVDLFKNGGIKRAMNLFWFSIVYLILIFSVMIIDNLISI